MKHFSIFTLSLFFIGVLVGLFMSFQIFSPKINNNNKWESVQEIQDTIRILNNSHQKLQNQISELRSQINDLESKTADTALLTELESLKKEAGLISYSGKGVRITLDIDFSEFVSQNEQDNYCLAAELRDIVNLLKASSAEGIAINDQRIISSTPITCFGSSVLVNNLRYLPPFTISAISEDPNKILAYLQTKKYLKDIYERVEEGWLKFNYKEEDEITIPVYAGSITPNYIKDEN